MMVTVVIVFVVCWLPFNVLQVSMKKMYPINLIWLVESNEMIKIDRQRMEI